MKSILNSIVMIVASLCGKTLNMANALDHKAMLYKLLGLEEAADEVMVNERYAEAMKAPADDDAKKAADELKAANEAKVAAEKLLANAEAVISEKDAMLAKCKELGLDYKAKADAAANEVKVANDAKTKAEECFANERKERAKLLLDAAVTANKITGAKRTEYETEFANVATFDATLAKLNAEKGTNLPGQRQAGMANIGLRRGGVLPADNERLAKIQEFANEEAKKAIYHNLPDDARYSRVMLAVRQAHPELYEKAS